MPPSLPQAVAVATLLLASCTPGAKQGPSGDGLGGHLRDGAGAADVSTGVDSLLSPERGRRDAGLPFDLPPPPDDLLIYAHTDTELFKLDPRTKPFSLVEVGAFDCVGQSGQDSAMTDLAVDRDGRLFGISQSAIHPLEPRPAGVHCVESWPLPTGARFYGLTFAPAGVLGPTEILVAANSAGELWAIDAQGGTTQVGSFGTVPADDGHGHHYQNAGQAWELSGDIVFLDHGGAPLGFATVRDCPNPPGSWDCNPVDTLIEIDVPALALGNRSPVTLAVRGQVVKGPGCANAGSQDGYGSMYGIAAWESKIYGFSRAGNLVEIESRDGSACLAGAYSGWKFAGAGVTTLAPVTAPD